MHIGGVTASPTGEWTVQQARNLALSFSERFSFGERFEDIKFLVRDRGSNFTPSFDAIFQAAGTRIVRTAVQAPRTNAICERLVGTLRRELLERVLILGEAHLRTVLAEYQVHYNTARPHQGIAQRVPDGEHDGDHLSVADLDRERILRTPPGPPDQRILTRRLTPRRLRRPPGGSHFSSGTGSCLSCTRRFRGSSCRSFDLGDDDVDGRLVVL